MGRRVWGVRCDAALAAVTPLAHAIKRSGADRGGRRDCAVGCMSITRWVAWNHNVCEL